MHLLRGVLVFVCIYQLVSCANVYDGITNTRVERMIDLTTQVARHSLTIEAKNTGSKTASEYYLAVQAASKLSYVQVSQDSTLLKVTKEDKVETTKDGATYTLYRVDLAKPLSAQGSVTLNANLYFTHSMTPFPAAIAQDEKQLVRYNDNHFFFSPYPTTTQITTVKLASAFIESKSEQSPTAVKGDLINYGPYEDTSAFTVSDMYIHFECNKPFITVTSLVKEIEISHWGNVAVEETYEMQHDGAKLKGTFSRFDYQRTQPGRSSVVAAFKQALPVGAADVYYRDEIGNISTSHLAETDNGPVMDVIPRYPLFGGWKIGFYLGYNLPTSSYLFSDVSDSSRYMLNLTFASAFPEVVVDQLIVRVILPEGARNAEVHTPFPIDGQATSTHFTYLDTAGRPVLTVYKYNVVPEHNQFFQVTYNFSQSSLLQEPILLIGAFFLFFLFIMLYTRIPFSIGGSKVEDSNDQ